MRETTLSRLEIERHMETVLASPAFKTSAKSQEFLRFVVVRSLSEDFDHLHERAIGVDLLRKPPDYDPAQDASVRVKANEVRKRLAKFYEMSGDSEPIRIDLPVGGYVPQFRSATVTTALKARPSFSWRFSWGHWKFWAAGVALALLGFVAISSFQRKDSPEARLDSFWAPVYAYNNPVIVCIPGLRALTPRAGSEIDGILRKEPTPSAFAENVPLRAGDADLFVQDDMVGMGAAIGAIRLGSFLAGKRKPVLVRIGQDVSFADLRSHPAVLLGAFSSKWTMEMNKDMPFVFVSGPKRIVETRAQRRSWTPVHVRYSGRADEDYAIVGRLTDSKSGQFVLMAAGITTFGTQSAAECLVEPDCIASLTAQAPSAWTSKNFQAVIHTKILGNTPSPPRVVASHVW